MQIKRAEVHVQLDERGAGPGLCSVWRWTRRQNRSKRASPGTALIAQTCEAGYDQTLDIDDRFYCIILLRR